MCAAGVSLSTLLGAALLGSASISNRVCFTAIDYKGESATPGGLHARICHAFPVVTTSL